MKSVGIVTDSHSGISQAEAERLGIYVVPMPFFVKDACYFEGVSMSREEFMECLHAGEEVHTSQPSPEDVMKTWNEALQNHEELIYMPLTSGLSGSCNTARMLAQEEEYEGKVYVVDNGRISALLHRAVFDALELVEEGYSAAQIKEILENSRDDMVIYIAVETLEFLRKGGRINTATAAIGTVLNIKPILKLTTGLLEAHKNCRGMKKARKEMIEMIRHDMEVTFAESYKNNEIYLLAASSADEEISQRWVEEIKASFPGMDVLYDPLTFGISCHIGPGGLGIGISCRPKR